MRSDSWKRGDCRHGKNRAVSRFPTKRTNWPLHWTRVVFVLVPRFLVRQFPPLGLGQMSLFTRWISLTGHWLGGMRKASANFVPRPRGQVFMALSLTIQANEIPIWSRMNETVSQLRNLEVQTRTKNSVVLIKKTIWRGEWKLELIGETLERVYRLR